MKKTFLFILLLISLFSALFAQESSDSADSALEEVNEQYETFSWSPVAKAKQYGVTIEKLNPSTEDWEPFKEIKTKEPSLEVLFVPGSYRVSICAYNFIGKKSQPSQWVQFQILEENVPYLNKNFLPVNPDWNVPVLFVDRFNNKDALSNTDSIYINNSSNVSSLYIDENYEVELLLLKGRNIFSPKTEFYLVPKDGEELKNFINLSDKRKELQLEIVSRDSKNFSVIVTYDPALLRPGYYSLEVRNPGDNTDSIDILVLDNAPFQISPDKGFEIDEHYSVNSVSLGSSSTCEISVSGTGLNSSMEFYLEPAIGPYAYPFESELLRTRTQLEILDTTKQPNSSALVTLSCNSEDLRTGYYNLVAKNWDGTSSKFLCLVKKPFEEDYTKNVKTFKSKFNKRSELVDVSIQDNKLSANQTYTLVSEYDPDTDSNLRVPLHLSNTGKKLVAQLSPNQLAIGKYALMIEDGVTASVIYCTLDNTLKLSTTKMSDSTIEKTFFRPIGENSKVTLDTDDVGSIQFSDSKIEMVKRMPPLFSNLKFDMSFLSENGKVFDLEFDVLHFKYASWSLGYENKSYLDSAVYHNIFSMLRVNFNNEYFAPYLAAGVGLDLTLPSADIEGFDRVLTPFTTTDQYYGIAQLGVQLLTILDVRYNLFYNNMFGKSPYFSDSISFGTTFPIRAFKFKRKVVTQIAQITKTGVVNGSDFIAPTDKIDRVIVLQSASVGGFAEYNILEKVTLDSTVQVVEENAFRDCAALREVVFEEPEEGEEVLPLTIKSNAFASDNKIYKLYLPYRTKTIQSGAFANWTNGQNIILSWNKDDETERDLTGLSNCPASVHYENGELYTGAFNTPLDDERNWVKIRDLKFENVSVLEDDIYKLGMRLKGWGEQWYKTELDTWINQESPKEIVDYLKSGKKLSFKTQGYGESYDVIITTEGGGYFYYKFKTKQDKVIPVEIPYKKMKKYGYSSQKKLDVEKIKMFCIMPMCKGEWNEVSCFDFEVE